MYYSDDFEDYNGNKVEVRWVKELWDDHVGKHPEIKNFKNASSLISDALLTPSLVMEGVKVGKKKEKIKCYYKEHKRHQNDVYFTKIVVGCNNNPFYVKTVFVQWLFCQFIVQEKKYNNFKEIWRDQKTYL